jgi:hypothetical protein
MKGITKKCPGPNAGPALSCPAGQDIGFQIPDTSVEGVSGIQAKGTISTFVVKQLTGSLDGFEYCLYDTSRACPPGANPLASATEDPTIAAIIGPVFVPSGQSYVDMPQSWPSDSAHQIWVPFANDDLRQDPVNMFKGHYLYLRIKANALTLPGDPAKTFGYRLTVLDTFHAG